MHCCAAPTCACTAVLYPLPTTPSLLPATTSSHPVLRHHIPRRRFWFYGDDNPEERLRLLDAYLCEFEARPSNSAVETQPLHQQERKVTQYYAAGDGEEGEQKVGVRAGRPTCWPG